MQASKPLYTETLNQFRKNNPTALDDLKLDTPIRTSNFKSMLISMYDDYEICTYDEELFLKLLIDTFNMNKDNFIEILDTYDKKYDIDELNNRINDTTITPNLIETHIDLPRSASSEEHPTSKDLNTGNSTTHTSIRDKENLITLKNQYLRQVRNIYKEFCTRFDDLFIHLF